MRRRVFCAALALCLCLAGCSAPTGIRPPERPAVSLPPFESPSDPAGCTALPIYLDGVLIARGYEKEEARYIPLRPLCAHAGVSMDWSGDEESFTLRLGGLHVEGESGREYFTASGRYLYAPEDWILRGEDLLLPEYAVCKLFNLTAKKEDGALRLDGKKLQLLTGGEDYYELNFPLEDVFWLAHIINSEAGIEPLAGKIGVGNVVLNRVASALFPNSVFGVVYDYDHAIQFEPVETGTIHDEPREEALLAAYMVLEGANTAGDCLYFVNPDFGSYWFDNNLEFVMKIGRHNFYNPLKQGESGANNHAGRNPAAVP